MLTVLRVSPHYTFIIRSHLRVIIDTFPMLNLTLYRNTAETRRRVRARPRGLLSPTTIGILAGQLNPLGVYPAVVVTNVYTTLSDPDRNELKPLSISIVRLEIRTDTLQFPPLPTTGRRGIEPPLSSLIVRLKVCA